MASFNEGFYTEITKRQQHAENENNNVLTEL